MKIELWFPTPIYSHEADNTEVAMFFDEINAIVEQEHQTILSQKDARSRTYTQSREIQHRQVIQTYELKNFHHFLLCHSKAFIEKLSPHATAIDIRESWFNFYEPKDCQEMHNHVHATEPSFLSGVFYWAAPENSGDLKIYQPNFNNSVLGEGGLESIDVSYCLTWST